MADDTIEGFDLILETDASNAYGLHGELTSRGGTRNFTIPAVAGQITVANLADVDITGIVANQGLIWNGASWQAGTFVLPTRTLTAGSGLSGGGDLSADRSFSLDNADSRNVNHVAVSITGGDGLIGGGTIASSQELSVDWADVGESSATKSARSDDRRINRPYIEDTGESRTVSSTSSTDFWSYIEFVGAGAKTYTIAAGVAGAVIEGFNFGAGNLTIAGSGVQLDPDTRLTFPQGYGFSIKFISATRANVIGGTSAS